MTDLRRIEPIGPPGFRLHSHGDPHSKTRPLIPRACAMLDAAVVSEMEPFSFARSPANRAGRSQVRSGPLPKFGDAEFRFDIPYCPTDAVLEETFPVSLAASASRFHGLRAQIFAAVAETRETVAAYLARDMTAWTPVLVSVGIRVGQSEFDDFDVVVDLGSLGNGLTPVLHRIRARTAAELGEPLASALEEHARHAALKASLKGRERGWMEQGATMIMQAVGMDHRFALEYLDRHDELMFGFDMSKRQMIGWLSWQEGVLRSRFYSFGLGDSFSDGHLTIKGRPRAARPGRRLGEVIDHPLVDGDAMILEVTKEGRETSMRLEIPVKRFRV